MFAEMFPCRKQKKMRE